MKKNKKQKNQLNDSQELRRLGVFIEHVDSNLGLIAEQHGEIKTDIDDIKKDIGSIKNTLNSHTNTLNSHTEMIGNLAVGMTIVKRDIEIMKTDIEFIKGGIKKKVDAEEFSMLERRVALLEKHR